MAPPQESGTLGKMPDQHPTNGGPHARLTRFWSKVQHGPAPAHAVELGPCWTWTASLNRQGYGIFKTGSKKDGTSRCSLAHRVSWETVNGPIPDGGCLLHRCDNPKCVRPDHLRVGTRTENSADKVSKGRQRNGRMPGETNPNASLNAAQVSRIRELAASGWSGVAIAREFGIHKSTACRVIRGDRYGS